MDPRICWHSFWALLTSKKNQEFSTNFKLKNLESWCKTGREKETINLGQSKMHLSLLSPFLIVGRAATQLAPRVEMWLVATFFLFATKPFCESRTKVHQKQQTFLSFSSLSRRPRHKIIGWDSGKKAWHFDTKELKRRHAEDWPKTGHDLTEDPLMSKMIVQGLAKALHFLKYSTIP